MTTAAKNSANFKIPNGVVIKAHRIGLIDSHSATELNGVLWYAAPVTHPRANLRFEDFFFKTHGDMLVDVFRIDCKDCLDTKKMVVYDPCEHCFGSASGCECCNFRGSVKRVFTCPSCNLTN